MKFTVEIPDHIIEWVQAEGVNRQAIAKFMREELKAVGTRWGHAPTLGKPQEPGRTHEWRGFVFNNVRVLAQAGVRRPARQKVDFGT